MIAELYQRKRSLSTNWDKIALPTDGLAALVLVVCRSSCAEGGGDSLAAPVLSTLFGRLIGLFHRRLSISRYVRLIVNRWVLTP